MTLSAPTPSSARRSACTAAAAAAQQRTIDAMMPLQRMKFALELGRRCALVADARGRALDDPAGGPKSALDGLSRLERNDVDLDDLQARCDSLGLGRELESVLALRGRFSAR
jgi:hypothetical protein